MLHNLLMLFPSYRQRERIAQYLIDLKTQNATLLFVLLHQKDMTIDFSYEDHVCRFFLPDACYDSIQNTIASTGSFYEVGILRKVRPYLREGMIYADIGANIGAYALFVAGFTGPRARILAVEPQPEETIELNEKLELMPEGSVSRSKRAASTADNVSLYQQKFADEETEAPASDLPAEGPKRVKKKEKGGARSLWKFGS